MDFESWLLSIKADERKYRLYELHKKHFLKSRFSLILDMVAIIILSILFSKMMGVAFSRDQYILKNFLILAGFMIFFYIVWITIPLYIFSRTLGLLLMGLRAISVKTLSGPSLLETYFYIGQDKRYSTRYPIYLFLVPDSAVQD